MDMTVAVILEDHPDVETVLLVFTRPAHCTTRCRAGSTVLLELPTQSCERAGDVCNWIHFTSPTRE